VFQLPKHTFDYTTEAFQLTVRVIHLEDLAALDQ